MARSEDIYPHFEPYDAFQIFPVDMLQVILRHLPPGREPHYSPISPPQAPQQPAAVLQQLPATTMPPGSAPSFRPGGHVKEDLVELMMIQNVQMQQLIMNNMTTSALRSLGSSSRPPAAPSDVVIIQENETDPEIYHHFYLPSPYLFYPAWLPQQATLVCQDPNKPSSASPHTQDRSAGPAPPPPPPSTAGTAGADVAPPSSTQPAEPIQQHPAGSTLTRSAPVMSRAPPREVTTAALAVITTDRVLIGDAAENSGAAEAEAEDKRE